MAEETETLMRIDILSPEGVIYSHQAYAITAKSADNGLTIMPNHIPLMTVLDIGVIQVRRRPNHEQFDFIAINGGNLSFQNNHCVVVATYAIRARDIDAGVVEIERQQAEVAASQALDRHDTVSYQRAQLEIERVLNLMRVSRMK